MRGKDKAETSYLPEMDEIEAAPTNVLHEEYPVYRETLDNAREPNEVITGHEDKAEHNFNQGEHEVGRQQVQNIQSEKTKNIRYNLRSHKKSLHSKVLKNILKPTPVLEINVENIQGSRCKFQYMCIKQALTLHADICNQTKCKLCKVQQQVKPLAFSKTNTSNSFFRPEIAKSNKSVSFHESTVERISVERKKIVSLSTIIKATYFNVSVREVALSI